MDTSDTVGFPSLGASANPELSPLEDAYAKPPKNQRKPLKHKDPVPSPTADTNVGRSDSPKRSLSPQPAGSLSPEEKRLKLSASLTHQIQEHDKLGAQSIDLLQASATFPSPEVYERELLATRLTSWTARNPGVPDGQDSANQYDPRPTPESVGLDATLTHLGRSFQFVADNMGPTLVRGVAQAQAQNQRLMNTLITQGRELSDLKVVKEARISELENKISTLNTNVLELETALKKQQANSLQVILDRSGLKTTMEGMSEKNVKSQTRIVTLESENEQLKETLKTSLLRNQTLLDVNTELSQETKEIKGAFDSTLRDLAILKSKTSKPEEPSGSAPASASSSATFAAAAVTPEIGRAHV
jgi:hypothetical protein